MYTLSVKGDFVAQHFLIGGDWGIENQKHSHHYIIEVRLEGENLDKNGYLVDIVNVKDSLAKTIVYCRDKTLNELPEFRGINPSIEHLARILNRMLTERILTQDITITIRVWEDTLAWASYRQG
jgi:6-pyruvoyltetrahydropterin/6-carboxytetrahydropterin synthase